MKSYPSAAETALSSSALNTTTAGSDSVQRPFMVDDLFELEDIGRYYGGPYAWSADGSQLAFTKVRAKKTLGNHMWRYLRGNAGGDVWVQCAAGESPELVTDGLTDGSGWWSPQWSPDGTKLAMLSTRCGNVHVWVWDRATGDLTKLSERGVDTYMPHERPYLWIDEQHVLYPALPEGELPLDMKVELQTPKIATREWPKVEKGEEVTASVLESGVKAHPRALPQGELRVADVLNATERTIAHGTVRSWHLSPTGETVAFTRVISLFQPTADLKLPVSDLLCWRPFGSRDLITLELASLDGTPLELEGKISQDVVEGSVRWSPDGDELVFFGYADGREQAPVLYRVNLVGQTVSALSLPELDVAPIVRESPQLEWTADGHLIVLAAKVADAKRSSVISRRDWWLIEESSPPKLLTEQLNESPRELWPEEGRSSFVGAAGGKLWRIVPGTGAVEDLTKRFDREVKDVSWPAKTNNGIDQYRLPDRTYAETIISVQNDRNRDPYLVDLREGAIEPIEKPDPSADLIAYEPHTNTAIFYTCDRNGMRVWRVDVRDKSSSVLVQANEFLRGIAEGEFKKFNYTSLSGETLNAWLLLPVGYQEGEQYPLLTWVYAGSVQGERSPTLGTINSADCLNLQIPAARGYAVLFPSMPLEREGVTDDPMLRLAEGVLPAVDKAIESGVANPNRLYLMGHSFGGFST